MKPRFYCLAVVTVVAVAGLVLAGCDRASDDASAELDDDVFRQTFVPKPDFGGGTAYECNTYTQDCPADQKCTFWGNDGGAAWNATRCSPLAAEPAAVGQACTVEGSATSGVDDCERGAMCWAVDPDTGEGTCVALLAGSDDHRLCVDPLDTPVLSSSLGLCLAACRPLQNDCPAGQGCYPTGDSFTCAPDISGDGGNAGDACEFVNGCSSGLACVSAVDVPGCSTNTGACCSPYCDTTRPVCPNGLTCQHWSDDTTLLPGGENTGICLG